MVAHTVKFWDDRAQRYAASKIRDQGGYEASLERVRSYLKPADHALEIGCGTGMTARLLAPSLAHIHATDISSAMIAIASEKARDEGCSNASFQTASVQGADRHGDGYDAVLAFNFLHLADDLPATLTAARDHLKPGGLFITKTPCLSGKYRAFWPMVKVMQLAGKAPPVAFMTPQALDDDIADAGFDIVAAENFRGSSMRHFVAAKRV